MSEPFHILNGDCLHKQLADTVSGQMIVMRECLIDGSTEGEGLPDFFRNRADFIENSYDVPEGEYHRKTVEELARIRTIPSSAEVNLWFEDDLFCQVNFWFTVYLLEEWGVRASVYLIRPESHDQYGFGGLSAEALQALFQKRTTLTYRKQIATLWRHYCRQELDGLYELASGLQSEYPFILPAVQAHIDRYTNDGTYGRPERSLLRIMDELDTDDFSAIFREFNRRESIYGFGDLQVKAMLQGLREGRG